MKYDNVVNMDTRTVISGIQFGSFSPEIIEFYKNIFFSHEGYSEHYSDLLTSMLDNTRSVNTIDDVISWITKLSYNFV